MCCSFSQSSIQTNGSNISINGSFYDGNYTEYKVSTAPHALTRDTHRPAMVCA